MNEQQKLEFVKSWDNNHNYESEPKASKNDWTPIDVTPVWEPGDTLPDGSLIPPPTVFRHRRTGQRFVTVPDSSSTIPFWTGGVDNEQAGGSATAATLTTEPPTAHSTTDAETAAHSSHVCSGLTRPEDDTSKGTAVTAQTFSANEQTATTCGLAPSSTPGATMAQTGTEGQPTTETTCGTVQTSKATRVDI
ncbi:hypothetical protein IAT40_004933 [Kwoniella sp. CBS 6097]